MNSAVKVLLGLVLIAIGLGFFWDSVYPIVGSAGWVPNDFLVNFLIVLSGMIPPFLILIGLFIVWLEIDEMKAERELKAEERKSKETEKVKEAAKPSKPRNPVTAA